MENYKDLYALQWNNHTKNLKSAFDIFRSDNELVDVTLSCEGRKIKAHKIVLSACSVYFLDLFRDNPCQHPIIILRDVKYNIMLDILNFMYQGAVNVSYEHLDSFLKTAELLQVKGLVSGEDKASSSKNNEKTQNDVPLGLVSNENDTYQMEVASQTSFKEEDVEFVENNFGESMEINLKTDSSGDETIQPDDYGHDHLKKFPNNPNYKNQYFPCSFCDKVFSHPNSLKLHLPRHSGSTSCELCQAVLSRKYELKVHMRKKHNIELY